MMPAVRRRSPLGYYQAFEITMLFLSGALACGLQRAARLQELLDESERCPVPRVASESNVLLPPLHNAGARHRMAGSDSGERTSSFAALVDSADAPATRAPRAPANRAAPASNRSQRPSGAPAAKNESTPDRANAADAAPEPSQPKKEPGATDGPETQTDSPDEKGTQDAAR
jgi:cytoskeletal protein RodZ